MAIFVCTASSRDSVVSLQLLVFVNLLSCALSVCPAGWALSGNKCYYIFENKLDKSGAASLCDDHSAELVSFANESEWMYISSLMKAAQLDSGTWTALTADSGGWKWPDTNYTELLHWRSPDDVSNRPNINYIPQPDSDHAQAKLIIVRSETYMMVDLASTQLNPFCVRGVDNRDQCDSNEDWINMLHVCHKYYPPATWSDAVSTCQGELGAEVYTPGGPEEFIPADALTAYNISIWMGASYKESGYYYEADNRPVFFLPWLDADSNYSNPNKTCMAALHTSPGLGFYMSSCEEELAFICRKPVGTCPLGWYQDGAQCFQLHIRPEERVTWFMAVDYCNSQNAVIAQDLSTDANTLLYNLLIENDVRLAWLGFSGSDEKYKYLNGKAVWGNYYLFDTTITSGAPSRCGVTDFDPRRVGLSLASYCYALQPFVCTLDLTVNPQPTVISSVVCDSGWIAFYDRCYQIIMSPMTYEKAVESCQSFNASIFHVNSTMDQSFLSTPTFMLYGMEHYWIGVKYGGSTNYFVFPETGEQVHFWNLDPLYNSSYGPCIYVSAGSNTLFVGSWSGDICSATHNFVCQKSAKPATQQPSISPTMWSSQCGVGWAYSNTTNLCYFVSPYVHKPWREARADCQSRQGDLLSIDGEVEQFAIESLLKSAVYSSLEESLWIGAGDITENNGWGWSNNRPFRYLHWAEGEPQYASDDGDNCGYIPVTKFFEWETRSCGDKLGFICRKSASGIQTGQPPSKPPPLRCQPQPLISGDHSILFSQDFSASSYKDAQHTPDRCRMTPSNTAAWSPANNSVGEWLAVTFHSPVSIASLQINGEADNFISSFKLQFQFDDKSPWYWFTNTDRSVYIFEAASVPDDLVTVYLFGEILAHAIKIWPVEWSFGIAIQLELSGCPEEDCKSDYAMSGPLFVGDRNIRASSELPGFESWNARLKPVRLNQQLTAWIPSNMDTVNWIEVDLGKNRIIQAITVAGDDRGNCVTQFQLLLSRAPGDEFITYSEPYGTPHTFSSQTDKGQTTTLYLQFSVEARLVRIVPLQWQGSPALKFDLLVCSSGCTANPMFATLPSIQLSASNSQTYHTPDRSKLNTLKEGDQSDGWKPLQATAVDASYIQADLGTIMQVTAVDTQGSASEGSWVTSYYLAFSLDGYTFTRYRESVTSYVIINAITVYNDSVVYQGNFDGSTVVKNELAQTVNARYVQLWPHGFHTAIALRWEIYACSKHTANTPLGCYADDASDPDLPYVYLVDKFVHIWPEACLSYCYDKGYQYAGLQNGNRCSCGNSYGMYGVSDSCNVSCQDPYTNFTCGGLNQNLVYSTGISANSYTCPPGWTSFRDSCYSLMYPATWPDAIINCQRVNSHLVDISDKAENDLLASMIGDDSWKEFSPVYIGNDAWIGFSDLRSNLNFEWTSGADVNFTNWDRHQPTANPGLGQHGVIMSSDGSWKNTFNEDLHSVMCETAKQPSNSTVTDTQYNGCLPEWRAGNVKCYRFYRKKSTWSQAQQLCASQNSTLARADSSTENIALSSALSQLDGSYWIDVCDVNATGLYTHSCEKVDVLYTNWARQKPDSSGMCISVQTVQYAGEWKNEDCENTNRFVCELPRTGYYPTQVISPNTKLPCPPGWEPHGALCYQLNVVEASSTLSWHEANENCFQQGAALASFHSDTDFITVAGKFRQSTGNFWIGLNNLDLSTGFRWSDGSVMNFVKWGDGQPRLPQSLSYCGEILMDTQTIGLQVCSEKRNWICSVQKGQTVTNITTEVIPPPENYGACSPLSGNWYKYKDYCYYVSLGSGETDGALTWRASREWCRKQGAELASVTSADENAFMRGRLNQGIPVEAAWIGLNELDRSSGYSWSDGTPVGTWQMNWNVNEPDDYDGFEGCVEMLARNGRWNDIHCSTRQGFICKQPAPGVNTTKPEPMKPRAGNCPPDFSRLGYKCYRLMGVYGELARQTWTNARSSCKYMMTAVNRNYSIDLASITSQEENAFITTLLVEHKLAAWVGLRSVSGDQFVWADNEDLGFEGWSRDEPNMGPGNNSCVYMYGSTSYVGKWSDAPCEETNAFICQGFVDPFFPEIRLPPSSQCNVTDGFQQFGNACYKVFNKTVSWQEAQASCSNAQASLATIMDGFDWAWLYLLSYSHSDGVWIGLNDLMSPGIYKWDSGFPVTYTTWARHQPTGNGSCVYMGVNGLYNNIQCTAVKAYVCRSDAEPPQRIPTEPPGFCSIQDFFVFDSTCYLFVPDAQFSYEMAGRECEKRGATLASISPAFPTLKITDTQRIWIGLRDSVSEGFSWEDSSVLDYTNWAPGQPAWSGADAVDDGCVVMLADSSWANTDCENQNGFLCAIPRNLYQTDLTLPPTNGMTTSAMVVTSPKSPTSTQNPSLSTHTQGLPTSTPIPSLSTHSQGLPTSTPIPSLSTHIQRLPTSTTTPSLSTHTQGSPSLPTVTATTSHSGITTTVPSQETGLPSHQIGSDGLTGGETAGIVVGVLAAVFTCIIIIIYVYQKRDWKSSFLRREASRVKNFENSLYAETRKDTLTNTENVEGINIVALDDDPRKLSVSYTVLHASDEFRHSGTHSSRGSRLSGAHSSRVSRLSGAHSADEFSNSGAHSFNVTGFSGAHDSDEFTHSGAHDSDEFTHSGAHDSDEFGFSLANFSEELSHSKA